MAQKLQDQFDKPVVVENRPGAGGDIGTEGVLKAEPDGHTLVMGSIQLTLKPALYKTLRFDPRRDATSIARLAAQPMIIVSRPDFPANTFPELIELAKRIRENIRSERRARVRRSILAPRCYARKPGSR